MSKSVHILSARVRLRGKVLRTKKKTKWVVILAICGAVTAYAVLTKCGMWGR